MAVQESQINDKLHWYKDAIIYELHIKAFHDGNCDGIGDFEGLLEKLDYLQYLGVSAIWLLPFYPSPLRDDGYDIADYYNINKSYGNIKQFRRLLKEAHARNLKVITELVINHTSDQHPWFQRARKAPKGSPLRDFYVWSDDPNKYKGARIIFQDFELSNWTWDHVAQQYYWHRFFYHQPDLNYDNPLVQQEVFRIIDYWCAMGVDGFRLDAVPYLFERDGTNCENLPETHTFLKKLRKHVDERFPGTLLLAEANMWPEDSASYFGNGDECQMNYHFPVMPRMFMAMQMEDRYPITDIFDQTPAIPDTCQWAIFLRNHDELTLEMVTDEERDYMYKVYAKDPKAKINLGIRHRLAPLLENNRRKIELLNCLLFSLPGTPVIYYGDEIGMGDNYYLGDRDGVRTPMQWSPDRNAGFSQANPQQLYLPVILDPEYYYESVNVETQRRNTSSLLWYMKRMIHMRKKFKAFGRGSMKFIFSENPKVLAFTRTYEDEIIMVIASLSKFSQVADLELGEYKGYQPMEIFSKNKFPVIGESEHYFFTLGPYDYQWFLLQKAHPDLDEKQPLAMLTLNEAKDLVTDGTMEDMENGLLQQYMVQMRWFGGKSRTIQSLKIINHAFVPAVNEGTYILLIEVAYESGLPEIYQLPVSIVTGQGAAKLNETCPQSIIALVKIAGEDGVLCDALYTTAYQLELFGRMVHKHDITLRGSDIHFYASKKVEKHAREHPDIKPRLLSAEQSNTSLSFDNAFFFKIYRKVDRAINPDMEITRFLTENARFAYVPAFMGAVEWAFDNDTVVLGMMQVMVESHGDAWSYMLERLDHYNETILSRGNTGLPAIEMKGTLEEPLAYDNIPQDLKELLEGQVAERVRLLGTRTAEMHMALASDNESPDFKPEEFSLHYQRSLFSSLQTLVRSAYQNMSRAAKKMPEDGRHDVDEIIGMRDEIMTELKQIYKHKFDAIKTRTHGDYHLGQVLFTGKDIMILDFEGEPARSYSERRLKRSPLRDVAGMLRSFHYAAYASLLLNNHIHKEDRERLMPYAELWYHYISGIFMQAYLKQAKGSAFIPGNVEDLHIMLKTYLLEKAFYEVNYELNNRPGWELVPLRGIKTLMNKT